MADKDVPIDTLRDRLTDSLAEWGAQISELLAELEQMRAQVHELRAEQIQDDDRVSDPRRPLRAQSALMADLQTDVQEGAALGNKVHEKDEEIARLSAELASKQELIRVLRRDAEQCDQLKAELQLRDQRIRALKSDNQTAKDRAERLARDLKQLTESAEQADSSVSELEALHAELDACKTLNWSLPSDLDRTGDPEHKLAEKQRVISTLEASVDRHAQTIADLHATIEQLEAQAGGRGDEQRSAALDGTLPPLSGTDVQRVLEMTDMEQTVVIDMSESLIEGQPRVKKAKS